MNFAFKRSLLRGRVFALNMSGEGFFSSRIFILSSAVLIGSGAAYIVYQQYLWARRQRLLSSQIVELKQQIIKLENDIKRIKEATAASSSDEMEEVFVDASDVAQEMGGFPGVVESVSSEETNEEVSRTSAQLAKILARLDMQMERGGVDNLKSAHTALVELTNKYPQNVDLQWRLAKSAFLLASEDMMANPDKPHEGQRELMERAHVAAETAVKLDNKNGDSHKWLAIIIGSITQFLPIQDQIKNAFSIKEHIQAAIQYKPKDALSYHMLGRWCYQVYMLTWVERKIASALFAVPPTATLEEAMHYFNKAEEIRPKSSIDNALYLAKCYIALQDYKKAVYWLRVGASLQSSSRDDMKSQNEIQALLVQYEA